MEIKYMKYESYETRNGQRGYYTEPESAENWIPMGDFKPSKIPTNYFEIPFTTWGDYAAGTVERANYIWFLENYKDNPLVYDINGGYNSHSLICHIDILKDESIKELIEGLDNYPLFDEETHSQLELELESESWDSWVKYDLKRALEKAGIEFPDDDSELESLFYHCIQYNNIDFECEDAVSAYIDLKKVIDRWAEGFCKSCNKSLDYHGQECESCPPLL